MKKIIRNIFILCCLILALYSCEKQSQAEIEDAEINNYLNNNNLMATKASSGIYYIIEEEGTGPFPSQYAYVSVYYKGSLLNGEVFDSTKGDTPFSFYFQEVIEGWQYSVPLLRKGGKGIFFIPSRYGYGTTGSNGIPGNSVLRFDIEMVSFREPQ